MCECVSANVSEHVCVSGAVLKQEGASGRVSAVAFHVRAFGGASLVQVQVRHRVLPRQMHREKKLVALVCQPDKLIY